MSGSSDPRVSVVILAKHTNRAKTRLGISREEARQVALALAAATVRAALAAETVAAVYVVTGDVEITRDALGAGADVVAEPRPLGMNRAAELGRAHAFRTRPSSPVVIMVADLPNLRPADLDLLVREHHRVGHPLYVADHEGTGTTLLVHGTDRRPGIGFGRGSASLHQRLGYRCARGVPWSLRRDLDTAEDPGALPVPEALTAS